MTEYTIYFWQRIVTPHMVDLAVALSKRGCEVFYVAEQLMSDTRATQGWLLPDLGVVTLEITPTPADVYALIDKAPRAAIHICQGFRANGLVGVAQAALSAGHLRQWVVMETVRDVGWQGFIKRLAYARLIHKARSFNQGVLAIGYRTPEWLVQRGIPAESVYPFAYFLDKDSSPPIADNFSLDETKKPFTFVFVGQFILRKRLDWLITALSELGRGDFELLVIGSGPMEDTLQDQARILLGDKAVWVGRLPSNEVSAHVAMADCLVLPSLHDGWGAVASEALMCGTPVICSDTCGSAGVVEKSEVGGVFVAGDKGGLKELLKTTLAAGKVSDEQRNNTITWSDSIAAQAGAEYLLKIFQSSDEGKGEKPSPPWVSAI